MHSHITEAILVADRRGRITYLNAAAERLLGVSAQDATMRPVGSVVRIVGPSEGTTFQILRALCTEGRWQAEKRLHVDGDQVHRVFISASLTARDNEAQHVVIALRDLTRVREQEAAIQHRLQIEGALVEASRMLVASEDVDFQELLGLVGRALGAGSVYLVTIPPDEQAFEAHALDEVGPHQMGMSLIAWHRHKDRQEVQQEQVASALAPGLKELLETSPAEGSAIDQDEATAFAVPVLSSDDQLYGYLGIEHDEVSSGQNGEPGYHENRAAWQEEDIRLLQALGDMLATYFERNMAEQALRESEERWRLLVESHPEPILISDEGRILYLNRAGAEVFGSKEPAHIVGRSIVDFVSAELHDRLLKRERAVLDGEARGPLQHEIIRLDGEDRIVESFSVPIIYQGRRVVQTVLRDITERKRSEERYRTFVETISEGIWYCDLVRPVATNSLAEIQASLILEFAYIVDCNAVVARALGVASPQELIGRRLGRLVRESGIILEFVEKGYRLRNAEYTFIGRDGTPSHFVVNAVGTVERGKLVRIWGSFIDVTERVELERRMVAALEEQQQRIGRDLHDGVGQLLTGIRMLCQNIAEGGGTEKSRKEQAHKVARYAEEASQHVRTIYKGLTPVQLYQEGLAAALEELAHNTDALPNIDCTFEHDGHAEVDDRDTILHMYRIAQEATNNALKHSEAAHVHITFRAEEDHILLQIQDNGIGFDAEKYTGSSLGLDSMFYRARTIQADFRLISEPGRGTIVRCTLPLAMTEKPITTFTTEA